MLKHIGLKLWWSSKLQDYNVEFGYNPNYHYIIIQASDIVFIHVYKAITDPDPESVSPCPTANNGEADEHPQRAESELSQGIPTVTEESTDEVGKPLSLELNCVSGFVTIRGFWWPLLIPTVINILP